ncbi:hypothetical protein [Aureliella helgolandensis]|uniref:Uncharacterized protein n=1 Tax=Aureliella helgolandensis TaxID=2527968 RepID=A0A518GD67_9BACT|nr:hypothetical protein [Aureliella helgolandensis]QDV26490.1 hypothetical protein Q31a_48640 [Aureliella helgolandensis]
MLKLLKEFFEDHFDRVQDIRNRDAMSMTLHDCIRLVDQHQQCESRRTAERVDTAVRKINQNLDSPQPHFIKSA